MKNDNRSPSTGKTSYNSSGDMCCPQTHSPPQRYRSSVASGQIMPSADCLVSQNKQLAGTAK